MRPSALKSSHLGEKKSSGSYLHLSVPGFLTRWNDVNTEEERVQWFSKTNNAC